jgi:hypothetical protein
VKLLPVCVLLVSASAVARAEDGDGATLRTQLQLWGTLLDQDQDKQADPAGYGDPEDDPGVALERAKLGIDGKKGVIAYSLILGLGRRYDALQAEEAGFGLDTGVIAWSPNDVFTLSAGYDTVPFSREAQISSRDLLFEERSVGTEYIAPYHQAGVLADVVTPVGVRVRAGVYNGDDPSLFGDDNIGKMLVGRVEWTTGDNAYTTFADPDDNAVGIGVAALSDTDVATSTMSLGVDALVRVSGFSLLAEAGREAQKPRKVDEGTTDVLTPVSRYGAMGQVAYFVPLGDNDGEGLEPGVRFAWFDSDTRQNDNGDLALLHVGATWRNPFPSIDVGAGYIHRFEFGGRTLSNDTVRVWIQARPDVDLRGGSAAAAPTTSDSWAGAFVGTWLGNQSLDGALIALWEQPGLGLVGSFKMDRPRGNVVVGRPYPLDSFSYADNVLRVRLDPYGENRDIVWFEFQPSPDGQLCGFGYEDGRRDEAIAGTGGGNYICWTRATETPTVSQAATTVPTEPTPPPPPQPQ